MRTPFVVELLLVCSVLCLSCSSIPPGRAAIDSVRIVGGSTVDARDVLDHLATSESPKFLGLFSGVASDYSIYDASILQRDLARVERYYRGRGFFEAHVRVARTLSSGADHVRVQIVVDEGRPVLNGLVRVNGLDNLPATTRDAVSHELTKALPKGRRFDEDAYRDAQQTALRSLTDRGYAYASVHADARVDLAAHVIDYTVDLSPGILTVNGPITFVGLDPQAAAAKPQVDEQQLKTVMHLREGAVYSTAAIESATQALLDLGVFSGVHVAANLPNPPSSVVPLIVQVELTKLRTVRLGLGAEFDETKTDIHALIGWEDHDFLGHLRDLRVELKPGLVLYPTNISDLTAPTNLFPEERLHLEFRQPSFLEARTSFIAQPELNVYPLLVEPNPLVTEPVVGYIEPKIAVGVERRLGKHLFAKLVYNFQGEVPFSYKARLDPTLPTVLLSFPQLVAQVDFKDDPIHPHAGFAADMDFQVAGVGGGARDVRIQPDVMGYIPISRGVTFALSGTLGLLFPFNYGGSIEGLPDKASPGVTMIPTLDNRDVETVFFRGFFSGGPNSNRGYPLRGVAPHGYVPFLNPATASSQAANKCDPNLPKTEPAFCQSPVGGFTQWEASAELRFNISGPLGAAVFCDVGDVSQHVFPDPASLRSNYLHTSCGVGGRYDTPVGPIRIDFGYRLPSLQIVGQSDAAVADPTFGTQPLIFGQPFAVAFGIGEAF